jgi:hypothetical protein
VLGPGEDKEIDTKARLLVVRGRFQQKDGKKPSRIVSKYPGVKWVMKLEANTIEHERGNPSYQKGGF